MTKKLLTEAPILVVGAGIMGLGIAQVAAQAGHAVLLYDSRVGAVAEALAKLAKNLDALVAKGKFSAQAVAQTLARIQAVDSLAAAARVGLVIEAIVESIDAKRGLFQQIEAIVDLDHGHCQWVEPAGQTGGHAFFQSVAADEAGRSRVGFVDGARCSAGNF